MSDFSTAFPNSQKVFVDGPQGVRVPMREIALSGGEAPIRVYDTSGPQGHDVRGGLPKLREAWVAPRRVAARAGQPVTQLHYARKGEITPEMVNALLARFNRPVETSVIPQGEMAESRLLFEIPVFHRHRAGGRSGMLRVYEQHVVFNADADGDSRFWRYADIRDIGQLGRYRFEIATFEGQFGVDGKSYIFDLKRPLTETEYEALWTKVYAQGRPTGLRPALSHQQE